MTEVKLKVIPEQVSETYFPPKCSSGIQRAENTQVQLPLTVTRCVRKAC